MSREITGQTDLPTRVQILRDAKGEPEYAVLPYSEFERLSAHALDLLDNRLADEALDDEILPWPMAKRLLAGENPIKLWREHRGLTQAQLARAVGTRARYISQLETGHKRPSLDLAIALAKTLSVTVDDLIGELSD